MLIIIISEIKGQIITLVIKCQIIAIEIKGQIILVLKEVSQIN